MQELEQHWRVQIWWRMLILPCQRREKSSHRPSTEPSWRSYSASNARKTQKLLAEESSWLFRPKKCWESRPKHQPIPLLSNADSHSNVPDLESYRHHGPWWLQPKQVYDSTTPTSVHCSELVWSVRWIWNASKHDATANAIRPARSI